MRELARQSSRCEPATRSATMRFIEEELDWLAMAGGEKPGNAGSS
jgi:hypothetical protein